MKAITSDEMRELEAFAVKIGIPSRVLMETAGMKVANIALHEIKHAKVATVICGSGGNGGDGFVAARHLHSGGIKTSIYMTSPADKLSSQDSRSNLEVLKNLGLNITPLSEDNLDQLKDALMGSDIVIDAIYGIGFKGDIKSPVPQIINIINETKRKIKNKRMYAVISVDVPSGADATTGEVPQSCVEADITVTFEYPKTGLFKYPASIFSGKILTTGIGIPRPNPLEPAGPAPEGIITEKREELKGIQVTDAKLVTAMLPKWKVDSHKGDRGRVLIVAGSSGMMGAGVLTANSALRAGAGLVTLCVPENIKNFVNTMSLEIVVASFDEIQEIIKEFDAIAIGPGLSKGRNISQLVNSLISSKVSVPIVIDADGLNAVSDPAIFKKSAKDIVITPHPGEFSRLTGKTVDDIQRDRMGSASRFATDFGITVVLKGAYTVIAGKDKEIFINPVGNPGMASAGVGDVLTGIITSLIGQGMSGFDAAVAGTYIHGMSANLATSIKSEHSTIASDIIDSIPYTYGSLM